MPLQSGIAAPFSIAIYFMMIHLHTQLPERLKNWRVERHWVVTVYLTSSSRKFHGEQRFSCLTFQICAFNQRVESGDTPLWFQFWDLNHSHPLNYESAHFVLRCWDMVLLCYHAQKMLQILQNKCLQHNEKSSLGIFDISSPPGDECAYDRGFWRKDLWKMYATLQFLWELFNFGYCWFMILNLLLVGFVKYGTL
jgi:hypothetical protein